MHFSTPLLLLYYFRPAVLGEWFNEEIDAATVIAEIAPLRAEIDVTTSAVEDKLARTYNVDRSELQQFRQDTMDELRATLTEVSSDE